MGFLDKLKPHLYLVKPYGPDTSVNWETVDLSNTIEKKTRTEGLEEYSNPLVIDFYDPLVQEEFIVFMNRDFATLIQMLLWFTGLGFYHTKISNIEEDFWFWALLLVYPCSIICAVGAIVDLYLFLHVDATSTADPVPRKQIARRRYWVQVVQLVGSVLLLSISPDMTYRDRNCVHAMDPIAFVGMRNDLNLTAQTPEVVASHCSRAFHIFSLFFQAFGIVAFTAPTTWIAIAEVCFLIGNVTLQAWYPYDIPLTADEHVIRYFFLIVFSITGVCLHYFRRRSALLGFKQQLLLEQENARARRTKAEVGNLLSSILPPSALERLLRGEKVADFSPQATVLFSDIKGFTAWSSQRTAHQVVEMLATLVLAFDTASSHHQIEKVKTIGDAYWAISGLPEPCTDHAWRICGFALQFQNIARAENEKHPEWDGISIRVGIHSGPLSGGILGQQQLSYEVFGDTNTIASKAEQNGVPGDVCITEDTSLLLGVDLNIKSHHVSEFPLPSAHSARIDPDLSTKNTVKIFVLKQEMFPSVPLDVDGKSHTSSGAASFSPDCEETDPLLVENFGADGTVGGRELNDEQKERLFKNASEKGGGVNQEDQNRETFEEVNEKYSKRKYKYLWPEFADPKIEEDFQTQLRYRKHSQQIWTRVCLLLLTLLFFIGYVVGSEEDKVASIVLFVCATVICLADLAISITCREKPFTTKIQAVLDHVITLCVQSAVGIGIGESLASSSVAAVHTSLYLILLVGNVGFISAFSLAAFNVIIVIIGWIYAWNRFELSNILIANPIGTFYGLLLTSILERLYRRQYLQVKVAEYFKGQQEQQNLQREALLLAMVPKHVVADLMVWMQTGMKAKDSIVQTLPSTVVGFLQFEAPAGENHQRPSSARHAFPAPALSGFSPIPGSPPKPNAINAFTASTEEQELHPNAVSTPTGEDCDQPVKVGSPDGLVVAGGDEQLPAASTHWLMKIHDEVDAILKLPFNTSVVKIKTIGDVAMLAGPFEDSSTSSPLLSGSLSGSGGVMTTQSPAVNREEMVMIAARQMLTLVQMIRSDVSKDFRTGLHIGELVGAVLGKSRLCFDIFGDAVNTASRVMTSGGASAGDITVSTEFRKGLANDDDFDPVTKRESSSSDANNKNNTNDSNGIDADNIRVDSAENDVETVGMLPHKPFRFGPPVEFSAKGKGTITVFRLQADS